MKRHTIENNFYTNKYLKSNLINLFKVYVKLNIMTIGI